jgi:hypothetical protein
MTRRLTAFALAVAAILCASTLPAAAKPSLDMRAASLSFFADVLGIVARTDAAITTTDGFTFTGKAAFVDLQHNRLVVAGDAQVRNSVHTIAADTIAYDFDTHAVDVLDAATGARHATTDLHAFTAEPIDSDRFDFPDLDDRRTYIRSRHVVITPHANVRFAPAVFPTSAGAVPVPSYMYTFASSSGFGATTLGGATFDQPYGIAGGPTSLFAAHFRYEDTIGPTVAFDEHLVYGDRAYIVTSIDSPQRNDRTVQLNAYQSMGPHYSQTLTAIANNAIGGGSYDLTAAFGGASAQFDFSRLGPVSTLDISARTPNLRLPYGLSARLRGDFGFDAGPGGLLISVLPNAAQYATVWRHGLDLFVSTPVVRAPLGTQLALTTDVSRTWFDFPHQRDAINGSATLSKRVSKQLTLIGSYIAAYSYDTYPGNQALFFPPPVPVLIAPDGTPYPGFGAFSGAAMTRGYTLDAFYAAGPNTSLRATAIYAADFPQFHGFGRPPLEFNFDARFRPFPNIGIDIGRGYEFDWGGRRFTQWTFSILP